MILNKIGYFMGNSKPFFITQSVLPQSFEDLLSHVKKVQNFNQFQQNYKQNRSFFKDSLELPLHPPNLSEVELFWLKMTAKTEGKSNFSPKNFIFSQHTPSIINENTFILWLLSVLELLWQKKFFELVYFFHFFL